MWCEHIWAVTGLFLALPLMITWEVTQTVQCVCLWAQNRVRARISDAHATHLIACGGLFVGMDVNSKEILLDLPSHLFCVMSLPAMWC